MTTAPAAPHRVTVVVLDHPFASLETERRILAAVGARVVDAQVRSELEAIEACRDADAVLVRRFPLTRPIVEVMRRCRLICNYGAGYDNVDVQAAAERGIPVSATAGYGDDEVADHTLALLLALGRRIIPQRQALAAAASAGPIQWSHAPYVPIRRLRDQTLGLVGFGRIGRTVARKASALGLRIIASDPVASPDDAAGLGVQLVPLPTLLAEADFVSLHAPLTPETRHLIGPAALASMKPTAYLINCARGALVDQSALLSALRSGQIAGAGLDVLESEPPPSETLASFLALPNVILTPHVAWYSEESIADRQRIAAETVRDALEAAR